jgi:hypothetical protein
MFSLPEATIKPNQKRASLAIQLLWAVMILDLFSMVSSYMQYSLLQDLTNGIDVSDTDLEFNDLREQLIALLYTVVYLISVVCFIQWFRRAYNNLESRTRINHDEGWAAGAWFVPIISLFRPYRIMNELFEKTHKLITDKTGARDEKNEGSAYIGVWWALWIIVGYIGNYSIKAAFRSNSIEDLVSSTVADIAMTGLSLPLGILAILIVTAYAKKEAQILKLETEARKNVFEN